MQRPLVVHTEGYLQALRRKPIHDHATGVPRQRRAGAPGETAIPPWNHHRVSRP